VIVPVLQDDALLADVRDADRRDGQLRLWWLGQSGFLVQHDGAHLLLDPYLSDSLTDKYAHTDKPHVRMTARVVDPARLDFIDVVTSSHNHTDHLDAATLLPLLAANDRLTLVVPEANREFVATRLGIDAAVPVGVGIGEHVKAAGFRIHAVPAAHETLEPQYVGFVVRCGRWTLYHSGDTVRYAGMAELLRPYDIDIALLPINGRAPERRVSGNLDGREAAELGRDIGARVVIPCHYDMFTFNTADPATFVAGCAAVGQRGDVLQCGERWETLAI
jgi:L-ascorbate metabolism protein UlaG (beta-lactamase superfamily)